MSVALKRRLSEGTVRFHHLLPGVWVMEVRHVARRWVVFHETYTFCLPTWVEVPAPVDWKYRRRLYQIRLGNTMVMEPGDLHANLRRTPRADFIVVNIQPSVMMAAAAQLGWSHADLHIQHPHQQTSHPDVVLALRQFHRALCSRPRRAETSTLKFSCACASAQEVHRENLLDLVQATIDSCSERARPAVGTVRAAAILRRAERFIRDNFVSDYRLDHLLSAAGCASRSTLLHAFKSELATKPSVYRNAIRIATACRRMVEKPDAPLDLIAREVGFSYDAYFVRRFKESLGTTPGAFRAAVKALPNGARREFAAAVQRRLVPSGLSL